MNLHSLILKFLAKPQYIPLTDKELASAIKLRDKEKAQFQKALQELVEKGKVVIVKNNKYCLAQEADLVPGIIKFRQNGSAVLVVDSSPENKERIVLHIRAEDTDVALNGDHVLVQIDKPKTKSSFNQKKPIKSKQPSARFSTEDYVYAKVVRILERALDTVIGTLGKDKMQYYIIPDDPHIIQNILVPPPQEFNGVVKPTVGDKVVVRLQEWKNRNLNPIGEIIEILGKTHTPGAEFDAVLRKYKLNPQFPTVVQNEAEQVESKVPESALEGRMDCRNIFTFTIDPDDAKDFDDAISVEFLKNEQVRLGVHIADVSAYVKPSTALDKEAQQRGNSTYLVGCVIPMLPHALSNGICSLVEKEDRLTKSVFFTFNKKNHLVDILFANTVIHSQKRLTYRQALGFLKLSDFDQIRKMPLPAAHETGSTGRALGSLSDAELHTLQKAIKTSWDIAKDLRTRRFAQGSLDLDMPEVKIYVDPQGYADRIEKVMNDESHQLIEEFMLLANESVARVLHEAKYAYISRVHDKPDPEKLEELGQLLAAAQVPVGDLTHKSAVQKLLEILKNHPQGYAFKVQFLRSLKQACYRAEAGGHYGLSKTFYAHFTSPIRRYSDLIVHRIFERYLWERKLSFNPTAKKYNLGELNSLSDHLSITERNSIDAERESVKVKLLEFFCCELQKEEKSVFKAIITEVRNHGFFVELLDSLAYGYINLSSLQDDFYTLSPNGTQLRGRRKGRTLQVGQIIDVVVERVDRFKRQMDFKLAETVSAPSSLEDTKSKKAYTRPTRTKKQYKAKRFQVNFEKKYKKKK